MRQARPAISRLSRPNRSVVGRSQAGKYAALSKSSSSSGSLGCHASACRVLALDAAASICANRANQSVPAKAEPNASMALRSAAPFSAKREKSWLKAVWMTASAAAAPAAARNRGRSDRRLLRRLRPLARRSGRPRTRCHRSRGIRSAQSRRFGRVNAFFSRRRTGRGSSLWSMRPRSHA